MKEWLGKHAIFPESKQATRKKKTGERRKQGWEKRRRREGTATR
jgi:hypothetical protein